MLETQSHVDFPAVPVKINASDLIACQLKPHQQRCISGLGKQFDQLSG